MQMTFVKYRTDGGELWPDKKWSEYAVIPTIWLSDFLNWLSDIGAEVLVQTDNVEFEARLPITWPSYETCSYGIIVSDAFHCVL
jgi:hypothetical protein